MNSGRKGSAFCRVRQTFPTKFHEFENFCQIVLVVQKIVVPLQRVFHSIRFKVNRGAAAPQFLFMTRIK